ncbi:MAG: D-alanine--D-alanine ligase [Cellvibrionaceae bacterium]|nr:D-alanine--D-alanine ligase [Cellvibrionaceae bacterium]
MRKALAGVGPVAVLYGGLSAERDVSLQSGAAIIDGLKSLGVDVLPIDINEQAVAQLESAKPAHAFIALHGGAGEDGRMQALLEYLQIPYTGSAANACAHAMDKRRCKFLWRGMGLPSADFALLQADDNWAEVLASLGGKVMVKPATEGSSIGMSPASSAAQLEQAYQLAAQYDQDVIAERLLEGAEYTVAVLAGEVLPPIKLETDNTFYDYDAKYIADDTRYLCPCGLPAEQEQALKDLAKQAFDSLGCQGWGRVDVMADSSGDLYLLEVNTVPGMTSHSLVPMAAAAAGLDFELLVGQILLDSIKK